MKIKTFGGIQDYFPSMDKVACRMMKTHETNLSEKKKNLHNHKLGRQFIVKDIN